MGGESWGKKLCKGPEAEGTAERRGSQVLCSRAPRDSRGTGECRKWVEDRFHIKDLLSILQVIGSH